MLVGNSRNADTVITDGVMTSWGTGGTVVTEPMDAKVTLAGGAFEVHRLNPLTGTRLGTIPVVRSEGHATVEIGRDAKTIYFELLR